MRRLGQRTRCLMCTSNKHSECDLHINDGAVDAEEFLSVSCDCPCEGQVQPGGKLIDLVAALRKERAELRDAYEAVGQPAGEAMRAHRALLAQIGEYLSEIFNDEGDGLSVGPYRNWLKTLRALQDRYARTLAQYPLSAAMHEEGDEDDEDEDAFDPRDDLSPGSYEVRP